MFYSHTVPDSSLSAEPELSSNQPSTSLSGSASIPVPVSTVGSGPGSITTAVTLSSDAPVSLPLLVQVPGPVSVQIPVQVPFGTVSTDSTTTTPESTGMLGFQSIGPSGPTHTPAILLGSTQQSARSFIPPTGSESESIPSLGLESSRSRGEYTSNPSSARSTGSSTTGPIVGPVRRHRRTGSSRLSMSMTMPAGQPLQQTGGGSSSGNSGSPAHFPNFPIAHFAGPRAGATSAGAVTPVSGSGVGSNQTRMYARPQLQSPAQIVSSGMSRTEGYVHSTGTSSHPGPYAHAGTHPHSHAHSHSYSHAHAHVKPEPHEWDDDSPASLLSRPGRSVPMGGAHPAKLRRLSAFDFADGSVDPLGPPVAGSPASTSMPGSASGSGPVSGPGSIVGPSSAPAAFMPQPPAGYNPAGQASPQTANTNSKIPQQRSKRPFTAEEDAKLIALKESGTMTWRQIADQFDDRSSGTLQVRYCTKLKEKTRRWTAQMENKLAGLLREYDANRWKAMGARMGAGFSASACRIKALELVQDGRLGDDLAILGIAGADSDEEDDQLGASGPVPAGTMSALASASIMASGGAELSGVSQSQPQSKPSSHVSTPIRMSAPSASTDQGYGLALGSRHRRMTSRAGMKRTVDMREVDDQLSTQDPHRQRPARSSSYPQPPTGLIKGSLASVGLGSSTGASGGGSSSAGLGSFVSQPVGQMVGVGLGHSASHSLGPVGMSVSVPMPQVMTQLPVALHPTFPTSSTTASHAGVISGPSPGGPSSQQPETGPVHSMYPSHQYVGAGVYAHSAQMTPHRYDGGPVYSHTGAVGHGTPHGGVGQYSGHPHGYTHSSSSPGTVLSHHPPQTPTHSHHPTSAHAVRTHLHTPSHQHLHQHPHQSSLPLPPPPPPPLPLLHHSHLSSSSYAGHNQAVGLSQHQQQQQQQGLLPPPPPPITSSSPGSRLTGESSELSGRTAGGVPQDGGAGENVMPVPSTPFLQRHS